MVTKQKRVYLNFAMQFSLLFVCFVSAIAEVTVMQPPILDTEWERSHAYDYLNRLRQKAGMSKLLYNRTLERAAQNHADYLIANRKIGHYEDAKLPHFSGYKPSDRVIAAGYRTRLVVENVSSNSLDYRDSIDGLFSAIYHRFGFLDFQIDEVGISLRQDEKDPAKTAYVYEMGIYEVEALCGKKSYDGPGEYAFKVCKDLLHRIEAKAFKKALNACALVNHKMVLYPYEEQTNVPPAFYDELPDPLPGYRVSGFPISVQFNPRFFRYVRLLSFRLFKEGGEEIKETKILDHLSDPNGLFKKYEYALFPLKRLEWGTRYRVEIRYRADGRTVTKRWYFRTRMFDEKMAVLQHRKSRVKLHADEPLILYFKPRSPDDILGDIRYSSRIELSFIDKNTIRILLKNPDKKVYRLHCTGREVDLEVAD